MKKQITLEEKRQALKAEKEKLREAEKRIETFSEILEQVDLLVKSYMKTRVIVPGHYEEYTDEETGEINKKYIWDVYETDEDGNAIYDEPSPDDWQYDNYIRMIAARDEILGLL